MKPSVKKHLQPYLYLAAPLLLMGVFFFYPLLMALNISLLDYSRDIFTPDFVGLAGQERPRPHRNGTRRGLGPVVRAEDALEEIDGEDHPDHAHGIGHRIGHDRPGQGSAGAAAERFEESRESRRVRQAAGEEPGGH